MLESTVYRGYLKPYDQMGSPREKSRKRKGPRSILQDSSIRSQKEEKQQDKKKRLVK
jgi:hypothetical protein